MEQITQPNFDPANPFENVRMAGDETVTTQLVASINKVSAFHARKYYAAFNKDMSTAERIGCLTRMIDAGIATDAEECELLDLINPFAVY